jgi:hypothetical protein
MLSSSKELLAVPSTYWDRKDILDTNFEDFAKNVVHTFRSGLLCAFLRHVTAEGQKLMLMVTVCWEVSEYFRKAKSEDTQSELKLKPSPLGVYGLQSISLAILQDVYKKREKININTGRFGKSVPSFVYTLNKRYLLRKK